MMSDKLFWQKVKKTDGCWLWTGCAPKYGQLRRRGGTLLAHRYSFELAFGEIPKNLYVLHSCDNKLCVRPDHLHLGTQAENVREAIERGLVRYTGPSSENSRSAKLTKETVLRLRHLYAEGASQPELAATFNLHQSTVSDIVVGKTWRKVGGPLKKKGREIMNRKPA